MRCPTLSELPAPQTRDTGWPWTEESLQMPDTRPDGRDWPRISIVTPSYNQGQFIEETIRSILLQGYPDLEYIITDGGSNDETVEIIRKYEPWITYWVSEPDSGQSHAINKGIRRATGEIVAWLNSDDLYLPSALSRIASMWESGETNWVVGKIKIGQHLNSPDTKTLQLSSARSFLEVAAFWLFRERNVRTFTQPEVFMSGKAWKAVGGLFEKLNLCMDYHLWTKLAANGYLPEYIQDEVSFFRIHESQKTRPKNSDYMLKVNAERSWALYDALRIARRRKSPPPDIAEVASALDKKAGGYCRVLDALYSGSGSRALLKALLAGAIFRPKTTLAARPRAIVTQFCFKRKAQA